MRAPTDRLRARILEMIQQDFAPRYEAMADKVMERVMQEIDARTKDPALKARLLQMLAETESFEEGE